MAHCVDRQSPCIRSLVQPHEVPTCLSACFAVSLTSSLVAYAGEEAIRSFLFSVSSFHREKVAIGTSAFQTSSAIIFWLPFTTLLLLENLAPSSRGISGLSFTGSFVSFPSEGVLSFVFVLSSACHLYVCSILLVACVGVPTPVVLAWLILWLDFVVVS